MSREVQRKNGLNQSQTGIEGDEEKIDDHVRCWQEVQQDVGCQSYGDYVKTYGKQATKFPIIQKHWILSPIPLFDSQKSIKGSCSIFDLSSNNTLQNALFIRKDLVQGCATRVLQTLHDTSHEPGLRITILEMGEKRPDEAWCVVGPLLDAIGLGLKIDPKVFEAYLEETNTGRSKSPRGHYLMSHCIVGRSIFTVARDYLSNGRSCPPVVLILDNPVRYGYLSELCESVPISVNRAQNPKEIISWPEMYDCHLRRHLEGLPSQVSEPEKVLPKAVIPLIEIFLENLGDRITADNAKFLGLCRGESEQYSLENREQLLEDMQFDLRQQKLDFGRCVRECKRYLKAQGLNASEEGPFSVVNDNIDAVCQDIDNLETSIRDWLQSYYGNLALEESKRSIGLSDLQIKESKRVKIFTVLAFIYLPLNLATSIFGMNLQQLNMQGQNIGVFVATALIALLLTGLTWFLVDLHRTDIRLPKVKIKGNIYQGPSVPVKEPGPSFMTRIGLLKLLFREGYHKWIWNTNAWLCILTNDRWGRIYFSEQEPYIAEPEVTTFNQMTVCDYVSAHAHAGATWFDHRFFFAERSSPTKGRAQYPDIIEHEVLENTSRNSSVKSPKPRQSPLARSSQADSPRENVRAGKDAEGAISVRVLTDSTESKVANENKY